MYNSAAYSACHELTCSVPALHSLCGLRVRARRRAAWNTTQPRIGLLWRDTHFSSASFAASLPGWFKSIQGEEAGEQMIDEPSRPAEAAQCNQATGRGGQHARMVSQRSLQARRRGQERCGPAGERSLLAQGGSGEAAQVSPSCVVCVGAVLRCPSLAHDQLSPPGSRRSSLLVPPRYHGIE